ncbi:hypothetical protein Patl1_22020 [Pistacia atlantica]|uniref:Uncharacterized protein n=1 Tax=Pistacia atlantica TaxID=434234 RepID=A0ACC1BNH8_9ROSI|nr:hypothetical protein Patl1_22020 [Pistacia atlantica]
MDMDMDFYSHYQQNHRDKRADAPTGSNVESYSWRMAKAVRHRQVFELLAISDVLSDLYKFVLASKRQPLSSSSGFLGSFLTQTMAFRPLLLLLATFLVVSARAPAPPLVKTPTATPPPLVSPPKATPPPLVKPPKTTPTPATPPPPVNPPKATPPPPVSPPKTTPPSTSEPTQDHSTTTSEPTQNHSTKSEPTTASSEDKERCKCVPPGTYGNRELCGKCYTDMTTRNNKPKCP